MTRVNPFWRDVQNQGKGWVGLLWELCLRASGSNDFTKDLEHHEGGTKARHRIRNDLGIICMIIDGG